LQGNERWVSLLNTKFHEEYTAAKFVPWVTLESGKMAGEVRSAGGGGFRAGNVTYVTVFDAGLVSFSLLSPDILPNTRALFFALSHMAPYDQPEAAYVGLKQGICALY
jgi:cathepsin A (carboxypeptidase C)